MLLVCFHNASMQVTPWNQVLNYVQQVTCNCCCGCRVGCVLAMQHKLWYFIKNGLPAWVDVNRLY